MTPNDSAQDPSGVAQCPASQLADPGQPAKEPVPDKNRLFLIDVLRGIALLGVLLLNIPWFASTELSWEEFTSNPGDLNFWIKAILDIFAEGKMRALFGIMFGAGVLLFASSKSGSGRSTAWIFYRRMFWLLLFGLAHAHLLLWFGDILYLYAICGMIIYFLRKIPATVLVLSVPIVAILDVGVTNHYRSMARDFRIGYLEVIEAREQGLEPSEAQMQDFWAWEYMEKTWWPTPETTEENTRKFKTDYASVASVVRPIARDLQTVVLPASIPDSVALMLFGMALLKWGFLTGACSNRLYIRTALLGYGLGLPLVLTSFIYYKTTHSTQAIALEQLVAIPVDWMDIIYPFQRILLVLAHISVIVLIVKSAKFKRLISHLAAVGQMAFTNYLSQTIICTLLFYGYGFSLYGELRYYQIFLVGLLIVVFQLLFSHWWLKHYRFGPMEWLWRSLTYWRLQPLRR